MLLMAAALMVPFMALNCCSGLSSGMVMAKRTTGLADNPLMIGNEGEVVTACTEEFGRLAVFFIQPKLLTASKEKNTI